MMLFRFCRKSNAKAIEEKEDLIKGQRKKLHTSVNKDLKQIDKINRILSNGIALEVKKAVGGHHG